MGCYVNPKDGTSKEAWLVANGEPRGEPCTITETHLPVCLVDNGFFTAAAVAYDADEIKAFQSPTDQRPKLWWRVSREKLREVSDLSKYEEKS